MASSSDAIVVGAGPNGLSAAIAIASAGRTVTVFEALERPGGGVSSAELTLPGFVHDVCSAVHPMGIASPFWRTLPLGAHGLEWVDPPAAVGHPLDGDHAGMLWRSLDDAVADLESDGTAYRATFGPVIDAWPELEANVLAPPRWPRHPIALGMFGLRALAPATSLARRRFRSPRGRAIVAGLAAHSMLPLDRFPSSAITLILGALAHHSGWPFPRGGAQRLTDALVTLLRSLGGQIVTGRRITNVDELPRARAVLFDLSPRPLLQIAGHRLPDGYRRRLERYRYGMGAFKVDWALDAPIPWRDSRVAKAGTVHVGGSIGEIAASERAAWNGRLSDRPFVLLSQPTLFDPSRAPAGRHVAWAYCHVPHGSTADALPHITSQIERFAPGFRDRILGTRVTAPADLEARNPNLVGGDIGMGVADARQLFLRPDRHLYAMPARGLYLCSASTPPGAGVHGMCGYFAAQAALARELA